MRWLTTLVASLVEAWGEVKVQRARVILSLIGVVAAVAAMSTVIALGDLIVQSNQEMMDAAQGRATTLSFSVTQKGDDETDMAGMVPYEVSPVNTEQTEETEHSWSAEDTGVINDPAGNAMKTVADRFDLPYWSRRLQSYVDIKELREIETTGSYRGVSVTPPEWGYDQPQIMAVDPSYATIYRLRLLDGRWLQDGDVDQRVMPVVVNRTMWEYFGRPNIADPMVITDRENPTDRFRVVGVVDASRWDLPTMFVPYDAWMLTHEDSDNTYGGAEMIVWTAPAQANEARSALQSALASVLGPTWEVSGYGSEMWAYTDGDDMSGIRNIIMAIGAVVIFLGALGLLNVAIVTVRQRIREIGIRRALGASAKRVFFSVFMESVVATFVAGVIGVMLAIIAIRVMPLESMDIELQDVPAFPISAALAGIAISTGIGALCGIIPALAAVRVRPIDAIRY